MLFRSLRHKKCIFCFGEAKTKPRLAPWRSVCTLVSSALKGEWYGRGENKRDPEILPIFTFFPNSPSQGMLALVLNCIDRLNIYNSIAHFAGIAREESGMAWKEILNLLYKLLGKYMPRALSLGRWLGRSVGIFVVGRGSPTGGFYLTFRNEWSREIYVLTKQETLLGRGAWTEGGELEES